MMTKITTILLLTALFGWPRGLKSQDTSAPQTGTSSAPSQGAPATTSGQAATPAEQPDNNPLSGAFMYTLGSVAEMRSYLQPALSLGEEAFTNPGYIPGAQHNFESITVPLGSLALHLYGKRNDFGVNYEGGGFIYNSDPALDSQFHEISLVDSFTFKRATVSVGDIFSYTPEAGFGLGSIGVLGGFSSGVYNGIGLSSGMGTINPMFAPNESILTTGYGAYSNTSLVEAAFSLSKRTSITAMGTYGTLQFGGGSNFINGNNADGMLGLNYTLDARNTIGFAYIYSTFHYVGLPTSFNSQMADFTYGRKITARLALQVYGGPDFVTYTAGAGKTATSTYVSGTADLTYAWKRSTVGLYVGRYSSGGSGVIPGAQTTTIAGNWQRQLNRTVMANFYGGYSLNSGFPFYPGVSTPVLSSSSRKTPNYNFWYGNLTLTHPLTRHLSLYIGYEYQRSSSPTCTSTACTLAPSLTNQIAGVGITYTPRPLAL
jgi:hypothetical protein